MISLPQAFTTRIQGTFGPPGISWLKDLPNLLNHSADRWELTLGEPFTDLSYNYVTRAQRADGTPVVLKLGVPNPELTCEIAALRQFAGQGAVELLEADREAGALLLVQLEPGNPVLDLDDDALATSIAAGVMSQLHQATLDKGPFPTIADWGRGLERLRSAFHGGSGPFPADLVDRAERLLVELIASQADPVLLHADLHHWNILDSHRYGWLAIDPKGLIGEREYEAGAWLRNPIPSLLDRVDAREIILRRAAQLSETLGFEPRRVIAWSQYQAVLAAWWSYEEANPNWKQMLEIAELIFSIK